MFLLTVNINVFKGYQKIKFTQNIFQVERKSQQLNLKLADKIRYYFRTYICGWF